MTSYPSYLHSYPNMDSPVPLHIAIHRLPRGFPAHRHDFLEFSCVLEGSGWESLNGQRHPLRPGVCTFVLPYQIHELHTDPGCTLALYNCSFDMSLLMERGADGGLAALLHEGERLPSHIELHGAELEHMRGLAAGLKQEYESGGDRLWRQTMMLLRLKEMLILFDRCRRASSPDAAAPASDTPVVPAASIWPVLHHLHNHYREDISLAELASRFSMSMSRLSERIKQTTGQTYVRFLQELRLRHACSLLVSTDLSVGDIAYESGHGSYKTFVRLFREAKGVSPSEYRKARTKAASAEAAPSDL